MNPLERLKSATDKALRESGLLSDDGPEPLPAAFQEDSSEAPAKPHKWESYQKLLNNICKGLSVKREELTRELAWRCDYFLPSANICNTPNGLASNRDYARKACSKCARPRSNKLTIEQEITREHLIEEIMDFDDCSY